MVGAEGWLCLRRQSPPHYYIHHQSQSPHKKPFNRETNRKSEILEIPEISRKRKIFMSDIYVQSPNMPFKEIVKSCRLCTHNAKTHTPQHFPASTSTKEKYYERTVLSNVSSARAHCQFYIFKTRT